MVMTEADNKLINQPLEMLLARKRELESGLAAASMHGVDAPHDLLAELKETQDELARRTSTDAK
jgi:hypothetical protein